jgi:hypothetical protein
MTETVPIGSIRLYDSVVPDIAAGVYRVQSSLTIDADGDTLAAPPPHDAFLEVVGPRFTLSPTDVAAVHPAPGSIGAYGQRLPHIALTRRTLPWERRFADGTPWLVLLVVRPDEATLLAPRPLREAVGEQQFATLAAAADIDGDGPDVPILLAADPITQAGLLPVKADVGLLSHVRQVNVADTELAMDDDDGWFAVVAANRLPTEPGPYTACLVSMEGREALLSASAATPTPFVVLHSWEFEVGAGGLFEVIARGLDVDALALPGGADPPVRLRRVDHDGRSHAATYRGPLRAGPVDPARPPRADDVGRAAAAELGRLLGGADGRFLQEVVGWHRDIDRAEVAAANRAGVDGHPPPGPAGVHDLLRGRRADPARIPDAVREPR